MTEARYTELLHKSAGSYGYHALVAVAADKVVTTYIDMMSGCTWQMKVQRRECDHKSWHRGAASTVFDHLVRAGYVWVATTYEHGNLERPQIDVRGT